MKIAITASGDTLDAALDPRFGRAENFVVYDSETRETVCVPNTQNRQAAQGAGIQAAQTVADTGAKVLLTGHCGPKAFRVLGQAGIEVYNLEAPTVRAAIERFEAGDLEQADGADVAGHWM